MRLLVVEDDPYWQQAIEAIIRHQPEYEVVAMCANLRQALGSIQTEAFDLMIVDLGLPDGSGIDAIRTARQYQPDADILVATVFADEGNVVAAIFAGATGYLLKESTPNQWSVAIEDLRAGNSPIDPKIARHILGAVQQHGWTTQSAPKGDTPSSRSSAEASASQDPKLSPREMEVLQLVAKGFTLVEVARFLKLSPHTTRSHAKAIYRKLEVNTRGEAVFEASLLGLI
ncbi:response regulator transcription factor [Rhizobium sp. P38BS-XIX]|uniref:response regulator transcription factor n=1 Tax=Rhizobium sp. P38BS-XIX TaxID=2726740 RepID=UPI001457919C|nr:response regulator transcription factor [Rhizobium sp. P38BS-XIX]NLS00809.1 response regulator transcription factor [Rhizobium sp. P38BS-XIX]